MKVEQKKEIDFSEYKKECVFQIGAYVFKLSDFHFIRMEPLDPNVEENKSHLEKGIDTQLIAFTEHGKFLAALCNFESANIALENLCAKINSTIMNIKTNNEKKKND